MIRIAGIPHLRAVRALQKAGFQIVREGKHIVMSDGNRFITIPRANPINAYTMGGIIKDAGLTGDYHVMVVLYMEGGGVFQPVPGVDYMAASQKLTLGSGQAITELELQLVPGP